MTCIAVLRIQRLYRIHFIPFGNFFSSFRFKHIGEFIPYKILAEVPGVARRNKKKKNFEGKNLVRDV